jgi:hypothetical protein
MSPAKSPNISGFFAAQTVIFLCTETQMQIPCWDRPVSRRVAARGKKRVDKPPQRW